VSVHSWQPQNLIEIAARPPEPPTIGGLLYPGRRTLLSGETESLKTWLALIVAKAEMDVDLPVAWADLDAMGAGELLDRLRALGVEDSRTEKLFRYYEPSERLVDDLLAEVCDSIGAGGGRLFVIDAFNKMLGLHGLDPSKTTDIEAFWREVADPLTKAGAAPTLLDHVVKNPDGRGKYAYGSERKASGAIVHIGFRTLGESLTRGGTGRTLLTTHKDRPGFLPRPTIGRLVLVSDGERISYEIEADLSRDGDKFRPTVLMERVSRALEECDEPVSKTWIEDNVQGKAGGLRMALTCLIDEGYVAKETTSRGWQLTSARFYREDDDPVLKWEDETASPPRPHRVPDLTSVTPDPTTSPRPFPIGDADVGRAATATLEAVLPTSLSSAADAPHQLDVYEVIQQADRDEAGDS
jgi:AAA domain